MTYDVILYKNTGFNAINIPDSPATLTAAGTTKSTDSVEILQDRFLSKVTVKASWDDVKDCDYCKVGDFYYSVDSVKMESVITATLSLAPDFITSAGIGNFDILDGVTSRATVSDDSWGKYTDDDPLTAPQRPLQIKTEWYTPSGEGTIPETMTGDMVFVESTISLPQQAGGTDGVTYTDSETGEMVTVPKTYPITGEKYAVTVEGDDSDDVTDFIVDGTTVSDQTAVYVENDSKTADGETLTVGQTVMDGLSAVRALGIEQGSILNQWRVPREYIGEIKQNSGVGKILYLSGDTSETRAVTCPIISIAGRTGTVSTSISPAYATVKNRRVLYGTYNRYGIMTTAGNSGEFRPEEITTEEASPEVTYKSDPRPKGKPYFRFTTINGNSEFWRNALAGSEWQNVPLVYQGASGSALTRLNFDNTRASERLAGEQYVEQYNYNQVGNVMSFISGITSLFKDIMSETVGSGDTGSVTGAIPGLISTMYSMRGESMRGEQYVQIYRQTKMNELSGLYQATTVYTPTVNFPYNADILRDVKGNAFLLYKYELSDEDVTRIDKLLTMYGYKESEPLTVANFSRRQKFDYVECSSVTVTGFPKWWNDGIADQLRNGVRVWHIKPDISAYSDNPVVS